MRIKLNNITHFDDLEIEFPNKGLVLLDADSGAGKTSVLDSIADATFDMMGSAITKRGAKKSKIDIQDFFGHRIIRTRSPHTLTVIKPDGIELKDDVAQAYIERSIFGMQQHEFAVGVYVRQGAIGSLLGSDPADQLKVIQSLTESIVDPAKIKAKIATILSSTDKELDTQKTVTRMAAEAREALESKLNTLTIPEEPVCIEIPSDITIQQAVTGLMPQEQLKTYIEVVRAEKQKIDGFIIAKEKDINTMRNEIKERETYVTKLEAAEQNLSKFVKDLAATERALNEIEQPWSIHSKQFVGDIFGKISKKKAYLNTFSEITTLITKVSQELPESKGSGKLLDFLKQKLVHIHEETANAKAMIKSIERAGVPQKCPACDATLTIMEGIIQLYHSEIVNIDASAIKQNVKDLAAQADKIQTIVNRMNILRGALGEDPMPEIKDSNRLALEETKWKEYERIQLENEKLIESRTSQMRMLMFQAAGARDEQKKLLEKQQKPVPDISIAQQELESLRLKSKNFEIKIHQAFEIQTQWLEYTKKRSDWEQAKTLVQETMREFEKADKYYQEQTARFNELSAKYAAAKTLQQRHEYAAVKSTQLVIDRINANANQYVERFLPDDGTKILLKSSHTTAAGEEKNRFGFEVWHKGDKVNKLPRFSGGELSRATLAFQLGLAQMYNSPLLMVDEGLTGMKPHQAEWCLEALKEFSNDRLVIVVDHGAPHFVFDHVVEL